MKKRPGTVKTGIWFPLFWEPSLVPNKTVANGQLLFRLQDSLGQMLALKPSRANPAASRFGSFTNTYLRSSGSSGEAVTAPLGQILANKKAELGGIGQEV